MLSKTDGGQVRYWDSRRRRCPYCFLPFKKVIVFIIQELRLLSRIPREKPRQSHELRICLWGRLRHIVPPRGGLFHGPVEWENVVLLSRCPVPFNIQRRSHKASGRVGIVPDRSRRTAVHSTYLGQSVYMSFLSYSQKVYSCNWRGEKLPCHFRHGSFWCQDKMPVDCRNSASIIKGAT